MHGPQHTDQRAATKEAKIAATKEKIMVDYEKIMTVCVPKPHPLLISADIFLHIPMPFTLHRSDRVKLRLCGRAI